MIYIKSLRAQMHRLKVAPPVEPSRSLRAKSNQPGQKEIIVKTDTDLKTDVAAELAWDAALGNDDGARAVRIDANQPRGFVGTIRSVLLHLDATPASAARLEFARSFALRHEADLSATFVAWPPQRPVHVAHAERPATLPQPMELAAADRAKSLFDNAVTEGGPPFAGWKAAPPTRSRLSVGRPCMPTCWCLGSTIRPP